MKEEEEEEEPTIASEVSRACKKRKTETIGEIISSIKQLESVIRSAVAEVEVIDVHTHLFPPSHGQLMLWGIDELLTYHYLVAEFFMTAPVSLEPKAFFALPKEEQSSLVWRALFVDRLPVSEAARGVVTVLRALGLTNEVRARDLTAIRTWFAAQNVEEHVERVFKVAGVRYVVMTNIPFVEEEVLHWRPKAAPYSQRFRAAVRVGNDIKSFYFILFLLIDSDYRCFPL